ncbi:MAG: class I SAM-dependent methyltransferase [Gemmatimonadota bacterium]
MALSMGRLMFSLMYRIGFTPWDGHPLPARLREWVEGVEALPPGKALDLGCGTGDTAIYLARHHWEVTAVDFVEGALEKARRKTERADVDVRYFRADATELGRYGLGKDFDLIVDSGLLHGLSDPARNAYVRELGAHVIPGGRLLILSFDAKARRGPRGISQAEVERRFAHDWELIATGVDLAASREPTDPIFVHALRRRAPDD